MSGTLEATCRVLDPAEQQVIVDAAFGGDSPDGTVVEVIHRDLPKGVFVYGPHSEDKSILVNKQPAGVVELVIPVRSDENFTVIFNGDVPVVSGGSPWIGFPKQRVALTGASEIEKSNKRVVIAPKHPLVLPQGQGDRTASQSTNVFILDPNPLVK